MRDFVKSCQIRDMYYTPYMLGINRHVTTILYLIVEGYTKLVYGLKFERELFRLSDGGTIAIDWVIDHEGGVPRKNS